MKQLWFWVWVSAIAVPSGAQDHHGHDDEHDDHREGVITLEPAQMESLDLSIVSISKGKLTDTLRLPAEVELDPMRVAHLTPSVGGIVKEVFYRLGDTVEKGEVLAILESRELGMAKSDYLAALAREEMRHKVFEREERLWASRISAEQDYLEAEQALAEARIELRQARETLYALGVSRDILEALPEESEMALNRYRMTTPFEGKIIEQHITLGEVLTKERAVFVFADTSRVWVMARVTERDLNTVREGMKAMVTLEGLPGRTFTGEVDFIGSRIDRETRTAPVRMVLQNPDGNLRAGMFGQVTVQVPNTRETGAFLVPADALQRMKDGYVVFRQLEPGRYEMVAVAIGAQSPEFSEVTGPLSHGDKLVTSDTFVLKSQAGKEEMSGGHNH